MMESEQLKQIIEQGMTVTHIEVDGDGQHFQAVIVSPEFEGKPMLAQHRLVKAVLKSRFDSGELHALSMRTLTPEQWVAGQQG
ncbi:MAG: BolA/IbaG family iron-sulfur metabolism protein [Aquisalimonadaceae bacterium]